MNFKYSQDLAKNYKYMDVDKALNRLNSGELYFAKPSQLNDTLEAKFVSPKKGDVISIFESVFSAASVSRGGPTFSFQPDNSEQDQAFVESILTGHSNLRDACENIGIFSTARRPDQQAMWAYYAKDRAGVCFEMDWPLKVLEDNQLIMSVVDYCSGPREHNQARDWANAFQELDRQNPGASLAELQRLSFDESFRMYVGIETSRRAASMKHTDWKHEDEIRILAPKAKALPILKKVLTRIHIVEFDCIRFAEIYQVLQREYPNVEVVQWQFDEGEFRYVGRGVDFKLIQLG